jgi:LPS-assembly lipoprotein
MSWFERLRHAVAACAVRSGPRSAACPANAYPDWSGIVALVATFALAGGIAGCGFHLRGDVTYPFSTLFINSPPNVPFTAELKRALAGSSSTTLVDNAAAAQVIFDVSNVTDDKQVLSLSGGGRAREFLLTKRVTFALHDAGGKDWLPAAEIVIRRSFTFSESEVLAREAEEARLYKEMQTDAVQQVVRRLQFARKPT